MRGVENLGYQCTSLNDVHSSSLEIYFRPEYIRYIECNIQINVYRTVCVFPRGGVCFPRFIAKVMLMLLRF
jgi:hypothetical protein